MKLLSRRRALSALLALLVLTATVLSSCAYLLDPLPIDDKSSGTHDFSSNVVSGFDDDKDSDQPSSEAAKSDKASEVPSEEIPDDTVSKKKLDPNGSYTSKDDVALYIHQYGKLPSNFITKKKAQEKGWTGGGLEKYFPDKSIGGDYFGNYEGLLPKKKGRTYTECDIDTKGKSSRGAKRIIFSNDGLIYYTDDHYESFTLLYGDPNK